MPYGYIKEYYGREFTPGQRVTFTEGKERSGTVRQVRGNPHYVRVTFDDGQTGNCHPLSLVPEPPN